MHEIEDIPNTGKPRPKNVMIKTTPIKGNGVLPWVKGLEDKVREYNIFIYIPPAIRPYIHTATDEIHEAIAKVKTNKNVFNTEYNSLFLVAKTYVFFLELAIKERKSNELINYNKYNSYVLKRRDTAYSYYRKTNKFKFEVNDLTINNDIGNIINSDYLIIKLPENKVTGYLVYLGFALASFKKIYAYGKIENFERQSMFHKHSSIKCFNTFEECINDISKESV